MQTIRLHRSWYRVKQDLDDGYSQEAYDRYDKLKKWCQLQEEGCFEATIYEVLQISRATIFRWQKAYKLYGLEGLQNANRRPNNVRQAFKQKEIESYVLSLRKEYPIFGKDKIKIMLQEKHGICASVSTIGEVLTKLLNARKISSVADLCGKKQSLPKRRFLDHAQRYDFVKPKNLGEKIQIDHMVEGKYKHFAAICPITKLWFAQVYTSATSAVGAQFLQEVLMFFTFKISSVQVDGGSEFMADFEQLCKKMNIQEYVLPPRSPKLNCFIERSNHTAHYEFYALKGSFKGLEDMRQKLSEFVVFYNNERPHQRLNYLTPMRYFNNWKEKEQFPVSYV